MRSWNEVPRPSDPSRSRRSFLKRALGLGAMATASGTLAATRGPHRAVRDPPAPTGQSPQVGALDHVAVPMRNVERMISFYRTLGFGVREGERIVSIHFADQKINFHLPPLWRSEEFTLRASGARPPCGDFCWVWNGSRQELVEVLERAGAEIEAEGERRGGRDGGDAVGRSVYTRDPDGNLLEFIRYP